MRRVVVVTRSIAFGDGVGGMERAAADHVEAMSTHGVALTLVTPAAEVELCPPGVVVESVPWPAFGRVGRSLFGLAYVLWTRRVRRRLLRLRFDVVHFHGASVGAVNRTLGPRAVANPHGMEEFGRSGVVRTVARAPVRWLSRKAARCAKVISTDASISPKVRANLRVTENQIVLIPNAVNVERLERQAGGAQPFDHFAIVSLGRVVPNKGHDLLLGALRDERVRSALPEGWAWHHFGSGPSLERLVRDAQRPPAVSLIVHEGSSDEEVQAALATADIFIQPSRYEGSSLTVLEAMSHGTPVIATPVGGIPDKIRHLVTGRLTKDTSPASIAEELARQVKTPIAFSEDARKSVRTGFSWTIAGRRYVELYEQVASNE